jgi:peptidoglycan/LPS O-acetylase OafA/YrhL
LFLSAALIGLGAWSCSQGTNLPLQDGLFGAGAACAMYAMAVQPMHFLARSFRWKWLTFIGGFSYTLYLMHHPIEQAMFWLKPAWIQGPQAVAYQFAVSLPMVILGTWLFSLVFERPFLSKPSRLPAAAVVESAPAVPAFLAHESLAEEEPMDFPRLPALRTPEGVE